MTSEPIARRFERAEAEATLPLVRRIVADIADDDRQLQAMLPRLRAARGRALEIDDAPPDPELEALRHRVAEITTSLEGYLGELARVGCVYRGETGHVDFRGELDGRPVFYCWAPGEAEVLHVHPLDAHCPSRQAIAADAALPGST